MLVVADSSPLVVLTMIGHIDKLPKLFGQVIIPPEVSAELHENYSMSDSSSIWLAEGSAECGGEADPDLDSHASSSPRPRPFLQRLRPGLFACRLNAG